MLLTAKKTRCFDIVTAGLLLQFLNSGPWVGNFFLNWEMLKNAGQRLPLRQRWAFVSIVLTSSAFNILSNISLISFEWSQKQRMVSHMTVGGHRLFQIDDWSRIFYSEVADSKSKCTFEVWIHGSSFNFIKFLTAIKSVSCIILYVV